MLLRIILSLIFVITVNKITVAQISLSLGNVQANSGETVFIPLNVTNFNDVGAISIKIEYNPSILTSFIGLTNLPQGKNFNTFVSNGVLTIGWFDVSSSPINIGNSKLCDLVFQYSSGSSNLNFITQQCEISNSNGQPFTLT
ncbi:MAG: cohesin domain-containing protein, partial [Ignavibacteria bacterium]|nr:cohesin domain-containing protein [Ignavibacteria bacterium]